MLRYVEKFDADMKKYIAAALLAMATLAGWATRAHDDIGDDGPDAVPPVTWLNKVHDFGAFDEDTKKKTAYFRFVNTGAEPLSVVSATATCGCTVPKYDHAQIMPGDTSVIEVSYDPSGRPGRFDKSVYVRTTASPEREKLTICGTVIGNAETVSARFPFAAGELRLRGGAVMFGRVKAGHTKMAYADGYNHSTDTIRPVLSGVPVWVDARVIPAVVPPGDFMEIDFKLLPEKMDQWGIVTDSLYVSPGAGSAAVALPIVAIVEEDFTALTADERAKAPVARLDGDRVDLGRIPQGASGTYTGVIKLTNEGCTPMAIRRVYSQDPGVEVSADATELAPGKSATITVTFDASVQPEGIVNARFTVITNDPDRSVQNVRVVAER